jgi:urease accessory protein
MHLIQTLPNVHREDLEGRHAILIKADRLTLAKRRWRATAENGAEFGFDLPHAPSHGAVVHFSNGDYYQLDQLPEPVLEIPYKTAEEGTRLAWQIGNLHFPCEVLPEKLRVTDDVALRQMLDREHIPHTHAEAVFQPLKAVAGGHSHGHSHSHEHEHEHGHPHSHGDHHNHA